MEGTGRKKKTKTKNKGGPGGQGLQAAPRRGPKGESWGILENLGESWKDHAWLTTCMVNHHNGTCMVDHDGLRGQFLKKMHISGLQISNILPEVGLRRM